MTANKKTNKIVEFIKSDLWIVLLDIIAVNGAYLLALNARFIGYDQLGELFHSYLNTLFTFAPFYSVICITVFALYRLYNGMWRYAGINDMNRIIVASLITAVIQVVGTCLFIRRMPITYYVIGAILQYLFIVLIRFGYRILLVEKKKVAAKKSPAIPTGIVSCQPVTNEGSTPWSSRA